MSNPFYYMAALMLIAAYPQGFEPLALADPRVAPWAVAGSLAVYAALCVGVLGRPLRRAPLARFGLKIAGLALYAQLIFVYHLPLWVWRLGVEDDPFLSTVLTLLPLMAFYAILAVVHARTDPHSGGLRFIFRGFLGLAFLPILLMLVLEEVIEKVEPLSRLMFVYPALAWAIALGSLSLLMVVLPPLLRRILGARSLVPGPLRDRLEQRCAALGFRATDLLSVPTGSSRMANAFVVGLSARWRYVFFTDAILDGMTGDELECVLVHEVTHAQKRHIPCFLIGALAFSLSTALVHEAFDAAGFPSEAAVVLLFGWATLYWGGGFGYVSRRFESEADLVAARLVPPLADGRAPYGAARRMAAALETVAALNHVPPWAWSWRHFTIEQRIRLLLHAELDPAVGAGLERQCDRFRRLASGLLMAGLLCGGLLAGLQVHRSPANRALLAAHEAADRGHRLLQENRFEEARAELRRGIDGGSTDPWVWIWLADAERGLGREQEARDAEASARRKGVTDPRLRQRLRQRP